MKITNITIRKLEIPMITSFTTSFGTITSRPTIIVELKTDKGITAYGESAALPFPFYKPETTDICMLVLKDYIAPLVLQKEFDTVEAFMKMLDSIKEMCIRDREHARKKMRGV